VGIWTAEMTMIRGMQKFDAIPAYDLGLRRVISHYYYQDRRPAARLKPGRAGGAWPASI